MQITFGSCRLDVARRVLFRDDTEVRLTTKAFDLLWYLVRERPRAVSKQELIKHIWQDTFVTEDGLHGLMNQVRVAIGDTGREPRCIRTIYAYGYAFEGDAQEISDAGGAADADFSACMLVLGTQQFLLRPGLQVLGRDLTADIVLEGPNVSRRHARIVLEGGVATVEDLGSKNGTFVGEQRLIGIHPLTDRDEIRIGDYLLIFHEAPPLATETRA